VNIDEVYTRLKVVENNMKEIAQIFKDDGIEMDSILCEFWTKYNEGIDVKIWNESCYILKGAENDAFPIKIVDITTALFRRKILFRKF